MGFSNSRGSTFTVSRGNGINEKGIRAEKIQVDVGAAWPDYVFTPEYKLKSLYEVIILPVTIRVVKYIKKVDGNDVYDLGTSYNILKVKDI